MSLLFAHFPAKARVVISCKKYTKLNPGMAWLKAHADQIVTVMEVADHTFPSYKLLAEDGTIGYAWDRELEPLPKLLI